MTLASEATFKAAAIQALEMREGQYSPSDLVENYLSRIQAHNSSIRAFINLDEAGARARATQLSAELENGVVRSRLHGTVFAVKDQLRLSNLPTTGGSATKVDTSTLPVATVVRRLEDAGAILVGTLNTHEFHNGPTRDFPFGRPRNPWNLAHSTGGSSSGSAASVSAGLCSFSVGGDTGGSIRAPAANCGVVGLKPTWSRVSRAGVIPLLASMDCIGPLTRSVEDAEAFLEICSGADPADRTAARNHYVAPGSDLQDLQGMTIGVIEELIAPSMSSAEAISAAEEAIGVLESMGARVVSRSIPLLTETRYVMPALVSSEAVNYHADSLRTQYDLFDRNTRCSMLVGALIPSNLVKLADRVRASLALQVTAALSDVDALVGPTAGRSAPPIVEFEPYTDADDIRKRLYGVGIASGQHTRPFSFAGVPALTVPCGLDASQLPLGLQIIGKHFGDSTVLSIGRAFEKALGRTFIPTGYS